MSDISASEYINQQNALEDEARGLMPWSPSHCTYADGSLRQPVFACLDCGEIGVCYSCSIQCHADCRLEELFTKRGFTCDCGTERQESKKGDFWCHLRQNQERDVPSLSNRYNQNFKGLFCDCQNKYKAEHDSTMIQCVLGLECNEEWYHCCCILRRHDHATDCLQNSSQDNQVPSGFPAIDSFEGFICWKCVNRYFTIFQALLSHRRSDDVIAHTVAHYSTLVQPKSESGVSELPSKRRRNSETDQPFSIMLKSGYDNALLEIKEGLEESDKLFIFLQDIAPFLISDEPVYEFSEDSDNDTSTFELGTKALNTSIDRDTAVAGIQAMDNIKKKLSDFLRPFAESGEVVKEEDIRNFFELQKGKSKDK
ncbi:LAQU0S02e08350g1_1 [Lachancea quebecensis]|uniref:LAQU0S02e08350g1_1 n=1 Tax=Lachancea quebecensis TaxID=1654605 RepID=A0A0N7ML38_9SACH|nr:LAQU0S02e08350g1_1 [Lachancea quebecensis]